MGNDKNRFLGLYFKNRIFKSSKMNHLSLYYWSIVVALAGFLFGFDTIVISGAELSIKEVWGTEGFFHSFFIMSIVKVNWHKS